MRIEIVKRVKVSKKELTAYMFRTLIDEDVGGIGQGGKGHPGIEKEGAARGFAVGIPGPAKEELVGFGSQVEVHMVQGMAQVAQGFIGKTLFKGRMVFLLELVHIGIQRNILKAGKVVPELPGVDLLGGINHLSLYIK